ncbi:MAG: L-glutamate gamma-semialdehyde dehydrogenase, partial [Pseudomonadota bacterium]
VRAPFAESHWEVGPEDGEAVTIRSPARPDDAVGTARLANAAHAQAAIARAQPWSNADATARRAVLDRVAELYEAHAGEIFALLAREAGKAAPDAVAELREAVDFLRFYGAEAARSPTRAPRGLITCISPWNFPLAIFTGQIAAALAAGNAVLAKPADPTPLIAGLAVRLMHEAGVPETALQLLPGTGEEVGRALTTDPRISGICFTGSTRVAQIIHRAAAEHLPPEAPLIAETGGINAMLVDSTSLPEQAVRDIVLSAFRSTGQRCSACRVLYVQADVADRMIAMLKGAMDELSLGDSWQLNSDLGPVITAEARAKIAAHIEKASGEGRLLHQGAAPADSLFLAPALLEIDSIADLGEEIFGPVLHVARFEAHEIDAVIDAINATGYGLTFGLHSRIDDRVEQITSRIAAGNVYVNRNQIGAVVGSQPFGGEGLSGTGPKAGGPLYLGRFYAEDQGASDPGAEPDRSVPLAEVETALAALPSHHAATEFADLPGPTGEANRWSAYPRGRILCLGPSAEAALEQARQARDAGCAALAVAPGIGAEGIDGRLEFGALSELTGFDAVALWSARNDLSATRQALATRSGPILPLITAADLRPHLVIERHLCIDTTAAGGNTALLAAE